MMTSSRPRDDISGTRRGHASQLSISDPSHHVTEAIGTLYGDEDDSGSEGGRPMSFISGSPYNEELHRMSPPELHERPPNHQHASEKSTSYPPHNQPSDSSTSTQAEHGSLRKLQTFVSTSPSQRSNNSYELSSQSPVSPTPSLRDVQADSTGSQFPLTNIDNPSDIAQELSNLQALRRLSMDVGNNIDPDMPPMGFSAMPPVAPSGNDDENDPSRLLWVPARVHPELAPTEFKTFLEKRVQSIRRRSGDPLLAADFEAGLGRSESLLRRNKSTLSRQIDNTGGRGAVGYVDGSERLERQRSSSGSQHGPELSLDELVKDPTKAVQRLAQETQSASLGAEGGGDDMPILPMAPGVGLRRSTRTTYRKGGSLRSRDRGSFSRRLPQRQSEGDYTDLNSTAASEVVVKGPMTAEASTESAADMHSQPVRSGRHPRNLSQETTPVMAGADGPSEENMESRPPPRAQRPRVRTPSDSGGEPFPPSERSERSDSPVVRSFPQRSSSQNAMPLHDHHPEASEDATSRPSRRPTIGNSTKLPAQSQYITKSPNSMHLHTMGDSLASPSSLIGADASRTDSLTFIPTLSQPEKKPEKKSSKKDKDEDSSSTSSRSGSAWKWFKGVTDDRDRKKEEGRKSKTRASAERTQDNVRLDVIQTSIDRSNVKGRESLVLDRDNVDSKLLEERKKESNRKSDSKKEKDGSIFSSIFGGSKKKEEKEKVNKKSQQYLQVPEDVSFKPLTPDVDYNWSRFPLLEERAIYRMAHIKLANPRRSLLSQVLLSNFMYSYLAIVQTMHPQMNVPTSPQQKRLEEEARRKRREEEYLARQGEHASDNGLDLYNFDYHRAAVQYADSGAEGQADYVDEAQIYEDEHGDDDEYGYEGVDGSGREAKEYLHEEDDHRRHRQDDMW